MSRRGLIGLLCAAGLLAGTVACSASSVTDNPTVGTVDDAPNAADTGCVDQPGTLAAAPSDWYRDDAEGTLVLNGDALQVPSDRLAPFEAAVTEAVTVQLGAAPTARSREFTRNDCVTHRYTGLESAAGLILVTVWRVEHAAQPGWIPNEAAFTADGDRLLLSAGPHLVVALAVAPDGTTVRVSAYGVGQLEAVAGWPTTMPQPPGAPPPGPAPATAEQVAAIATTMLEQVTDR